MFPQFLFLPEFSESTLAVCLLFRWGAWLVCSWRVLTDVAGWKRWRQMCRGVCGTHRRHGQGRGTEGCFSWCSVAELWTTLRIRCEETVKVEEVRGQPSWSSGRHGLCLRRGVYPSWGLGHSNEGGGREPRRGWSVGSRGRGGCY